MTSQSKVLVLILILGMRAASNLNLIKTTNAKSEQRRLSGLPAPARDALLQFEILSSCRLRFWQT